MTLDDRFAADFAEFTEHFATNDTGRAHLAAYERRRTAGRENFAHVRERAEAGEDTTWLVLTRLLPHADTPYNRGRGAWIHIAPAVTRDLKRWFERAGWVRHEEWPSIAAAILEFFGRVDADPDSIRVACREFGARNSSKGIQTGFLSPMLNALYPDRFCIVNSKSRKTARFFSSQRFPARIERYSTTNERLLDVLQSVAPQLLPLAGDGVLPSDVFDAFCH